MSSGWLIYCSTFRVKYSRTIKDMFIYNNQTEWEFANWFWLSVPSLKPGFDTQDYIIGA